MARVISKCYDGKNRKEETVKMVARGKLKKKNPSEAEKIIHEIVGAITPP